MPEHIVLLTGHLARPRLEKVIAGLGGGEASFEIVDLGVKVAALATAELIARRLPRPLTADRVILPGRCRGDLARLTRDFGVAFERGPDELSDLPAYLGRPGGPPDLSRHDVRIFAEIVEAPELTLEAILARAEAYRAAGADVIDLGCLPDTPFPHLEEAVQALAAAGHRVSVDSADLDELGRGGRAGAHYLLSLTARNLDLAREVAATPVLIPAEHGDLASLERAMARLDAEGLAYLADPVIDPIHFGFTRSLLRYAELRRRRPDCEILMGTGNLTELTDADTTGITALLMGIVSELAIANVLVVQVSPHTRRTLEEHDLARRIMFAARADSALPRDYAAGLLCLHDRKPFPNQPQEIAETAAMISDGSFRIEVAEDGIHVYNKAMHEVAVDPYQLFAHLGVEADGAHAFYLGVELARAEIALRLGKRYSQDTPLLWGSAMARTEEDLARPKQAGATLQAKRAKKGARS